MVVAVDLFGHLDCVIGRMVHSGAFKELLRGISI
jgi:hypothetical protein